MNNQTVIQAIASAFLAYRTCADTSNTVWKVRHRSTLDRLIKEHMPHGAGFDSQIALDDAASSRSCLVFVGSFHPMDADGYYAAWVAYRVRVRPTWSGVVVDVSADTDDDALTEHIGDTIHDALHETITEA